MKAIKRKGGFYMEFKSVLFLFLVFMAFVVFKIWDAGKKGREFQVKEQQDELEEYEGVMIDKFEKEGNDYFISSYKDYQKKKERVLCNLFSPGSIIIWKEANWEVISTPNFSREKDDTITDQNEQYTNYIYVKVRYLSQLEAIHQSIDQSVTITGGTYAPIVNSKIENSDINIQTEITIYDLLEKYIDEFISIDTNNNVELDTIKQELTNIKNDIYNEQNVNPDKSLMNKLSNVAKTAGPFASLASSLFSILSKFV